MNSKRNKWIKRILVIALIALIVIQFFQIDKVNPPYDTGNDFLNSSLAPAEVKGIIKDACYDCHSYETEYPWYTYVAPISFWIKGHIKGARQHLNFSIWNSYTVKKQHHKLEECIEEVKAKNMPLKSFTWTHSEAKLTDQQQALILDWFNRKMQAIDL